MSDPSDARAPGREAPAPTAAIGRVVGRGATWMVLNSIGGRVALLITQIGLGWLLSAEDFGIYGTAIGMAAFVQCFREAGVSQLLIQRGTAEYARLRGPLFWLALTANFTIAVALLGVEQLAAFADPRVQPLIWVLAVSLPLSTPASIFAAKLSMNLQFEHIARLQFLSTMIRYSAMLAFAAWGMGPLSFVLPVLLTTVFEVSYGFVVTGERPWRDRPLVRKWLTFLNQTKWLLVNGFASGIINYGIYPVLALILETGQVGVYVFAAQLSVQLVLMLSVNFNAVLFPAFQRLGDESNRQRDALLRALRTAMLAMAPASLLLAALFQPIERLIWHGRWQSAVGAVIALSIFFPLRGASVVYTSALRGRGYFRALCLLELSVAVGSLASAALGAALFRSPTGIAWVIGSFWGSASLLLMVIVLGRFGLPSRQVLAAVLPSWLLATTLAVLCLTAQRLMPAGVPEIVAIVGYAATFCILWTLIARLLLREHLLDALRVVPRRVAVPAARLLVLPHA